jgi:DNA-binding MurR/RpiR family transcriptional regulator
MNSVQARIHKSYNQLSNQQKLVAEFILEEPQQIALHPAKEIGVLTGTSGTTVIRLCNALGYSGFSAMQNEVRQSLLANSQRENHIQKFFDHSKRLNEKEGLITYKMEQDIAYISETLNSVSQDALDLAVESIIKAKKVVVVGFRSSYAQAHWLSYTLNIVKGYTHLYTGQNDDANYLMMLADEEWLVIVLSFPRYTQETISFAKAAKEKGAKILAFSDDGLSPIGAIADQLIKVTIPTPALHGITTIFSVLSVLIAGVTQVDRENVEERFNKYDQASQQFYPFASTDQ